MSNIVEFLTARLDEDERRYKRLVYGDTHWKMLRTSAHLGSWAYSRQNGLGIGVATNDALMDAGLERMRKTFDGWQRDHAKQWLAEVKAKRALIALHGLETLELPPAPYELPEGFTGEFVGHCGMCSEVDYPEGLNTYYEPWPCPSLRILASIYDQHPDYDEAWRPS